MLGVGEGRIDAEGAHLFLDRLPLGGFSGNVKLLPKGVAPSPRRRHRRAPTRATPPAKKSKTKKNLLEPREEETMSDLARTVLERHSTRMFLPRPVPRDLVNEALALAQHAPSNSNIQPWRLVFVGGAARNRLKQALFSVADHEAPHIPTLPKAFEHYRYELGAEVYGSMGITIADTARHAAAVMRNFDFFGTPLAGIVSMHRDLGPADAVSVGMYLQTLMLALTARGLGTCVEVSVAGYPDVVRTELSIPPELTIICGLAIGYTDPDFPANKLHIGRDPVEKHVVFLDN